MIACEIVTSLSDWLTHREEINDLLSTSVVANPHSTMTWLTSWWSVFGSGRELRIGLFRKDSHLVGYAPLMLSRYHFCRFPYRLLHFVGEGYSDYADIISRSDDRDTKAEIVRKIVTEWQWDDLSLMNVREQSSTLAAFDEIAGPSSFCSIRPNTRCLYIDLQGRTFQDYYKTLSRNHRHELQKRKNKLDALGAWSLEFNPPIPSSALFDQFRSMNTWRAKVMERVAIYEDPGFRQFICHLLDNAAPDLAILYSILRHGDVPISYTLGFVFDSTYYHWNIGFAREYEAIAPNKLHHQFLIDECFRRGYKAFDFMRGDSEYKFKWTDSFRRNYRVRVMRKAGFRAMPNRIQWIKERDPGSKTDRLIKGARTISKWPRTATVFLAGQKTGR